MPQIAFAKIQSSPNATDASYDIQFLDTMIAHHKQGVEILEVAVNTSQNQQVKNKAAAIMDNQESDIDKIQDVRDEIQKNAPLAINIDLDGMGSVDLKNLSSQSIKSFDKKFLKMMINHEEGGLEMAQNAVDKAKNSIVKELARDLVNKQTGEIAELKTILNN